MTRPSPVSAVHRALAGLSLVPVTHAADLAAQAKHLLQRRDGTASWLLAERLTRLRFGLIADDLVLRAIALAAMNNGGLARDDARNALAIDPRHPMANRLMLSSPDPAEREAAAHRLLRSNGTMPQIQDAPSVLWRQRPRPAIAADDRRRVAVIVPVYDDFEATKQCLDAVLAHPERHLTRRIIAVDDATPDRRIAVLLDELACDGKIELLRNDVNQGFAASVNRGLGLLAADEDAVLLNADTVPPPDLCARLARIAYLHDDIGTVTPLSNNGEYTSLPVRFRENPLPRDEVLAALDRLAAENAEGDEFVELPNGIGFCLYVKHAVLDAVGLLSLQFGRGYCEDIDFCLRAGQAGFRNVCAIGVFVGHAGTRSFKSEKRALVLTNLSRIDALYPSYRRQSAEFVRRDPLRALASRLEWKWLLAKQEGFGLLVGPREFDAGLIGRHAEARRASGLATFVASLDVTPDDMEIHLRDHAGGYPQNVRLTYGPDRAAQGLADDLARLRIAEVAIADPGNLPADVVRALTEIGAAYDVLLADAGILDTGILDTATLDTGGEGEAASVEGCDIAGSAPAGGASTAAILAQARRILTPTPRFRRALISRMPHLAARIDLLPVAPLGKATVRPASGSDGSLLVVSAGASIEESALIHAFAARLQQADPEAGLVVDGPVSDDFKTMELGNVFVLGRPPGEDPMPTTCHTPTSGVVFASRRWGMSDMRVDAMVTLGLPVAYFDRTLERSKVAGEHLLLSAKEPLPAVVSALLQWWRRLSADGRVATPARAADATSIPSQPG